MPNGNWQPPSSFRASSTCLGSSRPTMAASVNPAGISAAKLGKTLTSTMLRTFRKSDVETA